MFDTRSHALIPYYCGRVARCFDRNLGCEMVRHGNQRLHPENSESNRKKDTALVPEYHLLFKEPTV
jgi:hypothetical protein